MSLLYECVNTVIAGQYWKSGGSWCVFSLADNFEVLEYDLKLIGVIDMKIFCIVLINKAWKHLHVHFYLWYFPPCLGICV